MSENPTKKETLYGFLRSRYNDDMLSAIFESGKRAKGDVEDVKLLEATYFQKLLGSKQTPDDVFTLLKLDKAGDDLLSSPQLNTFISYLKVFNKEKPDQETTLIATMIQSYGDDGVIQILQLAKRIPATKKLAGALETAHINYWLSLDKEPEMVFKTLKLDLAGENLILLPQFETFTRYTDTFANKYPRKKMSTMAIIRNSYHDNDLRVAKMIMAAEDVPTLKNAARRMEDELFKAWADPMSSPDTVFKALHLETARNSLFTSPVLKYWMKFMNVFNKAKPGAANFMIGSTLTTNYGNLGFLKMIVAAEKVPSTQKTATMLENELFKSWTDPALKLDDIFSSVKLDTAGEKLFTDPMLSMWMKFLDTYNKMVPGKARPRTILTKIYDDQALVDMVKVAKENPKTKTLASKMETEMLTQFLYAEKQPLDVAHLLNVKEKTDSNWKIWKKYMQDYHKLYFRGITT